MPREGFKQPEVYNQDHKRVTDMADELKVSVPDMYKLVILFAHDHFGEVMVLKHFADKKGSVK